MPRYETINYENIKDYGINILTGEACAFGMRLLCDMSAEGVDLLCDFYGLKPVSWLEEVPFPRNVNSRVKDKDAIASCMLTHSTMTELYKFILFSKGYEVVVSAAGDVTGMSAETWEEVKLAWPQTTTVRYNCKSPKQPSVGSRNVHAFTGRSI